MNKFEYERVFCTAPAAVCHPSVRHLLHVLVVHVDFSSNTILPQHAPSITELAREMGTDRRTATRRLKRAERAGWISRDRPTVHDARTKHARTLYTLTIPRGYPQARGMMPQQLGAASPGPGGSMPQQLGADDPAARGTQPRKSVSQERSSGRAADIPFEALCGRCGSFRHKTEDCTE